MFFLAALSADSTAYRLLLLGHLLCVIVGFGSTFVYPFLGNHAAKVQGKPAAEINNATMTAGRFVTEPFIVGVGVFGFALAVTGPFGFGNRFVGISMALYLVAMVFSFAVHQPNLKRMNALANELADMGPPPAGAAGGPPPQAVEMEKRSKAAARNGGVLHLLFAAVLILMVWKPL